MASNYSKDDFVYDMQSTKKSLLVIFCFEHFQPRLNLEQREGTHQDCERLRKLFEQTFGFETDIFHDLRKSDVLWKLDELSFRGVKNRPSLVLTFLSHGNQKGIFARDELFELKDIIEKFNRDNCPSLVGKPKIIIIQVLIRLFVLCFKIITNFLLPGLPRR